MRVPRPLVHSPPRPRPSRCPVCPSVPGSRSSFSSQAHLTASAPFRVRAPGPVSGRLFGAASWRAGYLVPVSRRVSAAGVRFSVIPFPPRDRLSSRSAHRPIQGRTQTGLPRSARTSCDRGGCPLCPEDDGAHPGLRRVLSRAPAAPPRLVPKPRHNIPPCEALLHEASNRGSRRSPVRSSPRLPRRDGTSGASASPRASHPTVTGSARRGREQAIEHGPGTTAQLTSVDLQSGSSLVSCDIASHRAKQGPRSCRRDARTSTKAGLHPPSRAGASVAAPRLLQ